MHIHILGIAGNKTAPIAYELHKQGHLVTGSDQQKIFPPVSTELEALTIKLNQTPINSEIDLAIIGNSYNSFENCRKEFEEIKKLNIPYVSSTEYISKYLIKPESILVAGSYGKTTISSLLSYVLIKLKLDPSYMFAGSAIDQIPSVHFGQSQYSIVESDENHNGLDIIPTFLYYQSKYVILTSARWEHKESFSNQEENLEAFKSLIIKIPESGCLIYNPHDSEIQKILQFCKCTKIPYTSNQKISSKLIGKYNQENISAVITLCNHLKLDESLVKKAISEFSGVKRRLEIISEENKILIIDDFAQSATRVRSALEAVRFSYPQRNIYVYFEPHATFLRNISSLQEFSHVFDKTTKTIIGKISFSMDTKKEDRVTATDWKNLALNKIDYLPIQNDIVNYFSSTLKPNDILIHFSSGGLDGLNTLNNIKKAILNIHS